MNKTFSRSSPVFQMLPESKKNKKWIEDNLDYFETLGVNARASNSKFNVYYKMLDGEFDFNSETSSAFLGEINKLREGFETSETDAHYDFLDNIRRIVVGTYLRTKGDMTVSTVDNFSKNEFIAEKTNALNKYIEETYNKTLEIELLKNGVSFQDNFESEEEKAQYTEYLESEKEKIISLEERESSIKKNFKTAASEWGAFTLERDSRDFEEESLISDEITDRLCTGRLFRHFFVGPDYYRAERWDPRETFFDNSPDIKYPQYGSHIGRVTNMTVSDIINRYGTTMSYNTQKDLAKSMTEFNNSEQGTNGDLLKTIMGRPFVTPYAGYFEDQERMEWEQITGAPFSKYVVEDEEGNKNIIPTYTSPYSVPSINLTQNLRTDIDVRNDLMQVTEVYWRSYEEIAIINFTNEDNAPEMVWVTSELISDVIKTFGIKKLKNISIDDMIENPRENTICYSFRPEIRKGVKIMSGNSTFSNSKMKPIYIDGKPLKNQIRRDSEQFDVCLPVGGYIGSSMFKKMKEYVFKYNLVMNQTTNLLEKELGQFLLFDFKYLPSEFKENEDSIETLNMLFEAIREVGIAPIDTSKRNLGGDTPNSSIMQSQSIDYTSNIQNRIGLADIFENKAWKQFGINMSSASQSQMYVTAEGVKSGAENTYAQTEMWFNDLDITYRKIAVLQLNIAQTCQKDNKDFKNFFIRSTGESAFLELNDDNFPLRMFDVHITNNAKDKRELEELKRAILNSNTQGSDMFDFAKVVTSKSCQEVLDEMYKSRERQDKIRQEGYANEQELANKNTQAIQEAKALEWDNKKDIQEGINSTGIEKERIKTYGRIAEKDVSNTFHYDRVDRITERSLAQDNRNKEFELRNEDLRLQTYKEDNKNNQNLAELKFKLEDLKERKQNRLSREAEAARPRK